jgi:hypothetical protein
MSGGYAFAKIDGTYLVGLPDPSNPNFTLFTTSEVVHLKYITPQAVLNLLGPIYGKFMTAENVVSHPATGSSTASSIGNSSVNNPTTTSSGYGIFSNALNNGNSSQGNVTYQPYQLLVTATPAIMTRIKNAITPSSKSLRTR